MDGLIDAGRILYNPGPDHLSSPINSPTSSPLISSVNTPSSPISWTDSELPSTPPHSSSPVAEDSATPSPSWSWSLADGDTAHPPAQRIWEVGLNESTSGDEESSRSSSPGPKSPLPERPSDYLRARCPLCFGGSSDPSDLLNVYERLHNFEVPFC